MAENLVEVAEKDPAIAIARYHIDLLQQEIADLQQISLPRDPNVKRDLEYFTAELADWQQWLISIQAPTNP